MAAPAETSGCPLLLSTDGLETEKQTGGTDTERGEVQRGDRNREGRDTERRQKQRRERYREGEIQRRERYKEKLDSYYFTYFEEPCGTTMYARQIYWKVEKKFI